jgi:hypothetical protein
MTPKKFLSELKSHSKEKYQIVTSLRKLVFDTNEKVSEEIKYGGLLYFDKQSYTGLFVYKNHVTMEFSEGTQLKDPKNLLEGDGKHRKHLKFKSDGDIDEKEIVRFLKQAIKIARS